MVTLQRRPTGPGTVTWYKHLGTGGGRVPELQQQAVSCARATCPSAVCFSGVKSASCSLGENSACVKTALTQTVAHRTQQRTPPNRTGQEHFDSTDLLSCFLPCLEGIRQWTVAVTRRDASVSAPGAQDCLPTVLPNSRVSLSLLLDFRV